MKTKVKLTQRHVLSPSDFHYHGDFLIYIVCVSFFFFHIIVTRSFDEVSRHATRMSMEKRRNRNFQRAILKFKLTT